jgi:hypothetical protein
MGTVPVGTIIAFNLANADFNALAQQGWWVCDGRTVTDPAATILLNQPTPNLMNAPDQWRLGRFLVGAGTVPVGTAQGAAISPLPEMQVTTETNGFDGNQTINQDPSVLVWKPDTWVNGHPITSSGKAIPKTPQGGKAEVAIEPPFYAVIYLILVK